MIKNEEKEVINIEETRAIKFFLDESVNKSKKQKIINFLEECQEVENQLYKYYWEHIDVIINSKTKIDFTYNNKISFRDLQPQLKSHHFQQVLKDMYGGLKGHIVKIKRKIYIRKEDTVEQQIYNYCKGFCFEWDDLQKYIKKQISKYKNQDSKYIEFLKTIQDYIGDKERYGKLKLEIEKDFNLQKSKIKCPQIKNPCLWCNTAHTIDLKENSYYDWYFLLDNNHNLKPEAKRGLFERITIPIKYSDYHHKVLKDKKLNNSFKIGLNKLGQIEIMGTYNIEVEYPINTYNNVIGVDIGLKKLITCSDGEIVYQNKNIIKMARKIKNKQSNRKKLQNHLQKKYNDETFKLSNNRYLRQQNRLTRFVICDNRYKIKQFLKGRENDLIVMEDLEIGYSNVHNKETNYLLRRLHIQAIKDDLIRYCKELGINNKLVNPSFTSQLCPICGCVDKKNRKTQEMFCCVNCGHTDNADFNASINIRDRVFDSRITTKTPTWRIKEILEHSYNARG